MSSLRGATENTLVVSEIFGPTFQGEGPTIGRPCMFLRLGACNLGCVWCDSAYTWKWGEYDASLELEVMDIEEVYQKIRPSNIRMLVVTGGEPMLQQQKLRRLTSRLIQDGWWIEIETAGTIMPKGSLLELAQRFNVSPKLENSGNPLNLRYKPDVLIQLERRGRAIFKFVVQEEEELEEVQHIVDECDIPPRKIYIMPEGTDVDILLDRTRALYDACLRKKWNLTTRLQCLLFGNKRKV